MRTQINDFNQKIIQEFRSNAGKVGGPFAGSPMLLLTTTGAKSGREHVTPVVVTTRAGEARLRSANHPHVRIIPAGDGDTVDLAFAMRRLRQELGVEYLLCEGGPTLYGNMSRAGLIDEKFVTVSPIEVGLRIPPEQEPTDRERAHPPLTRPTVFDAPGFTKDTAPWWTWVSCRKAGEHQFSRYRRVVGG